MIYFATISYQKPEESLLAHQYDTMPEGQPDPDTLPTVAQRFVSLLTLLCAVCSDITSLAVPVTFQSLIETLWHLNFLSGIIVHLWDSRADAWKE